MNGGVIFIKRKSCNSWHLQHEGLANVIFLKCGCSFCSLGVGGRYDDTTSSATHSDSWEAKYALVILFRKRKHSSRNVEWPSHNIDNYFESVFKPSKNSTANKFTPNAFGQEWVRSHVPKVDSIFLTPIQENSKLCHTERDGICIPRGVITNEANIDLGFIQQIWHCCGENVQKTREAL